MRIRVRSAALFAAGCLLSPLCAFPASARSADEQSIAALEVQAQQAEPREQCFLYAELLHQMTDLSVRNYAAGEVEKANTLLKRIQSMAGKIHFVLSPNDKRLKNAEILLSNTAYRLKEMLHASDYDNRPLVEQTLASVSSAQDEAMMQVFAK